MPTTNDLFLGPDINSLELLSALGRKFTIDDIEIVREDRTASGRLVKDIIAVKKSFSLAYKMMDGETLLLFLALFDIKDELIFSIAQNDSDPLNYNVLMSPISRQRLLAREDGLWEGVNVVLREV